MTTTVATPNIILDAIASRVTFIADELCESTINRWCHPAHVFIQRWPMSSAPRWIYWETRINDVRGTKFWNLFLLIGLTGIQVGWPRRDHRTAEDQGAATT